MPISIKKAVDITNNALYLIDSKICLDYSISDYRYECDLYIPNNVNFYSSAIRKQFEGKTNSRGFTIYFDNLNIYFNNLFEELFGSYYYNEGSISLLLERFIKHNIHININGGDYKPISGLQTHTYINSDETEVDEFYDILVFCRDSGITKSGETYYIEKQLYEFDYHIDNNDVSKCFGNIRKGSTYKQIIEKI